MRVSYNWLQGLRRHSVARGRAGRAHDHGRPAGGDDGADGCTAWTTSSSGKCWTCEPHPDAEQLFVVRVARAARGVDHRLPARPTWPPGDLVPVAKPGAKLPDGTVIQRAELRGVVVRGHALLRGGAGRRATTPAAFGCCRRTCPDGQPLRKRWGWTTSSCTWKSTRTGRTACRSSAWPGKWPR